MPHAQKWSAKSFHIKCTEVAVKSPAAAVRGARGAWGAEPVGGLQARLIAVRPAQGGRFRNPHMLRHVHASGGVRKEGAAARWRSPAAPAAIRASSWAAPSWLWLQTRPLTKGGKARTKASMRNVIPQSKIRTADGMRARAQRSGCCSHAFTGAILGLAVHAWVGIWF